MSNLPTRESACKFLGCADSELVDIFDSPAGVVYQMSDGNALIDVDAATPDADGKTGLMFVVAPPAPGGYKGDFPVFVNPDEDDETVDGDDGTVDLSTLTKAQLIDHALDVHGVELPKAKNEELIAAIEALRADAAASAEGGPTGDDAENGGPAE